MIKLAKTMKKNVQIVRMLIEALGISQQEAARQLKINERTMRRYCSECDPSAAPESVVMALRYLAQ